MYIGLAQTGHSFLDGYLKEMDASCRFIFTSSKFRWDVCEQYIALRRPTVVTQWTVFYFGQGGWKTGLPQVH